MRATGTTTEQHMLRMTDSSERMMMYMAGMTIIGGDSEIDQIAENWGDRTTINKALTTKAPLMVSGFFEYCDEFGEYVCHRFMATYTGKPIDAFNLNTVTDCFYSYPNPGNGMTVTMKYLLPCEQPDEREKNQRLQREQMIQLMPSPIPPWASPTVTATPNP
jgi:hypothetical protein